MNLEKRLKTIVQNRLQHSLEVARKRGYKIASDEFLTATTCCAFGATYVVQHNLHPNRFPVPEVNVFTIVKLLDLPLSVVDAFLDGFDFESVPPIEPGYPRYQRDPHAGACYAALHLGCQFKRLWLSRSSQKKIITT